MLVKEGHNIDSLSQDSMKADAILQSLTRKGLINDNGGLTIPGQELLEFMNSKIARPIVRKKTTNNNDFNEWWEAFPSTDQFEYKGRIFTGSRSMRVQKEKCLLKFNSIVNEGVYTARQLIDAMKYVVLLKKEASFKKKSNELTYLKNTYNFLHEKESYEPFVKLSEKGIISEEQQVTGSTDI